jgi:hypothetical protein
MAQSELLAEHKSFLRLLYPAGSNGLMGYQYQETTDERNGPGEFKLQRFFAKTDLPMPLDRKTFSRFGIEYDARLYDFKEVPGATTGVDKDTLHRAVVKAGLGRFLGDDILATGTLDFGMYTDLDDGIDTDDYQLQGEALGVYRINPGAQLIGGFKWGQDFEDITFLPLIGLRLLSTDGRIHVSATLPLELRITYGITPATDVYAGIWIKGDRFRVRMGEDNNEFDLQIQERNAGIGIAHWFGKHFSLGAEGGLMMESQFEFKFANAGQFDEEVNSAPYLRAFIGFAL